MTKGILPNDFRDFLSILSLIGFLAIFFEFVLDNAFLSENMTSLFLLIGGAGLMVAGKVFTLRQWIKDGIQGNEITWVLSLILGISAMLIGLLMFLDVTLPERVTGLIGFIALGPAIFIALDYLAKNS